MVVSDAWRTMARLRGADHRRRLILTVAATPFDLAAGTERVVAGDYLQRLPVVQDDELGALAESFNRIQAGLAERQRREVRADAGHPAKSVDTDNDNRIAGALN